MTPFSYDPDGMWHAGHHILPDMQERHRQAKRLMRDNTVDSPSTIFDGALYESAGTRWEEAVADFASRLGTSGQRLADLGEAVKTAVLNHMRTDQLSIEAFDLAEYRSEVLEELQ